MPLVLRVISPSVRFTKVIIAPIVISQNSPTRNPDCAKMYGRPRIPAPMIVPVKVNVAAQNFLLILSPRFLEGGFVFNCFGVEFIIYSLF